MPNAVGMRTPGRASRTALGLAVAACAVFAALLLTRPAPVAVPAKSAGADRLVLTWADGGDQLQVDALGYRAKTVVDVRLGSQPIQQARADVEGRVRVSVPGDLIGAGQPGTSIIVIGRSRWGTARTLLSAVPPRAAGRGPIDALPWAVAAVVLAHVGFGVWRRRRGGRAASTAGAPGADRAVAPVGRRAGTVRSSPG